jgi:hypothetical protein
LPSFVRIVIELGAKLAQIQRHLERHHLPKVQF